MKKVQILLSTYNGEKYLDEQIESLIIQEGVECSILVRDDGSSDRTISKLNEWEFKGVLSWYAGENLKPARSFMDLIKNAPSSDYYAFCDQDDVWDKNKLEIAVTMLEKFDDNKPAMYFSNTRLVDGKLRPIKTENQKHKITLGSALVISPVAGCTVVFNNSLIRVIRKYDNINIQMHDRWTYKLCMAIGGNVIFDETSHIAYRQHGNNFVGGSQSIYRKYRRRVKNVLIKRSRSGEKDAKELINGYSNLIPEENLEKVKKIAFYRTNFKSKLNLLLDKDIRTNSLEHNFAFVCGVLFNAF